MTSTKICAALAAILALSAGGAAMAQSYGPNQPGDPSGYGPPPPPPYDANQSGGQQGYGPPPPYDPGQPGGQQGYGPPPNDQSAQGAYAAQSEQYSDQRDDYDARMARYHSQQALYQHQLRVYERVRHDYDMQFGPGAYERYYAPPPPPPGE
jgi:hypothetical protein